MAESSKAIRRMIERISRVYRRYMPPIVHSVWIQSALIVHSECNQTMFREEADSYCNKAGNKLTVLII